MILYCVSLFLKNETFSHLLQICAENGVPYKELTVTDQTNERVHGYQIESGVKILLLPDNDFHKDGDFEIGLTAENQESWDSFVKQAGELCETERGTLDDGKTEYLLMGSEEEYHGNFFFIFDGTNSDSESLSKIRCTVKTADFDFFTKNVAQFIEKSLRKKIEITSGESFRINELRLAAGETEITLPIVKK